jgi:hypothetical protein
MSTSENNLYNAAAKMGTIHLGIDMFVSLLLSIWFFVMAYYNYSEWNFNIVELNGIVKKINTVSGVCDQLIQQVIDETSITYNCPLIIEYTYNSKTSNFNLNVSSNVNYKEGQSIALSYDKVAKKDPTLQLNRINPIWNILFGSFFLLYAYASYRMAVSDAAKPYKALLGVNYGAGYALSLIF